MRRSVVRSLRSRVVLPVVAWSARFARCGPPSDAGRRPDHGAQRQTTARSARPRRAAPDHRPTAPTTLILTATPLESDLLAQRLAPDGPHRLAVTGMAAVNTAHSLTRELLDPSKPRPDLVIQAGIGGAYVPGGLQVGDLAIATEEVYGDVGVITPDGWLSAEAIGIPLLPATEGDSTRPARFNHFPLDAELASRAAAITGARTGRFLTLAQVTGIRTVGDELYARHSAICESMEGAAAAHVCALHGIPFLEIRAISNLVEDRHRSRWRLRDASLAAQHATLKVLEHLEEILITSE